MGLNGIRGSHKMFNQRGSVPILIILAAFSIIVYLLISSVFPFKDKLFSSLYPKPPSHAAGDADTSPETSQSLSVPVSFSATVISPSQINLSWFAPQDATGVAGYEIFRDNVKLATVTTISYGDTGLLPATTYNYYIRAIDGAGNFSPPTNTISATSQSQLTTVGNIKGGVSLPAGSALSGVRVLVRVGNANKIYLTDSKGLFNITSLPGGLYSLNFEKSGYVAQTASVNVSPGLTADVKVILTPR